jgi:hypothetical protein
MDSDVSEFNYVAFGKVVTSDSVEQSKEIAGESPWSLMG